MTDSLDLMSRFLAVLPHAQALGIAAVEAEPGAVILRMPWDARLIGDPETRVVHGGAVSALLDTTCGGAVMSHPSMEGASTATLSLRLDYLRPAPPETALLARAECYHVTRSVALVRGEAWSEGDPERPVAMATGTFTAADRATAPMTDAAPVEKG